MNRELMQHIREYAQLLENASTWGDSSEILAPVITEEGTAAATSEYIYEFYCYISVINDLRETYSLKFIEGAGKFKFKFPRAASNKHGKPRFHAYQDELLKFQICAGTKISCSVLTEDNNPDISFQRAESSENPTEEDLIFIMDAKFREDFSSAISKDEIYKFHTILDLFDLKKDLDHEIHFTAFSSFVGNCLITNGKGYSNPDDFTLLRRFKFKEVHNFFPNQRFVVHG